MAVAHLAPYRRARICWQLAAATCNNSSSNSHCDFVGGGSEAAGVAAAAAAAAAGSSFVLAIAGNEKLANMPRFALHRPCICCT